MSTLAQRVKIAMQRKGCTVTELAAACGVKPPSVSAWLTGDTKTIKASVAHRAARFLGVNFLWLIEGIGPVEPDSSAAPIESSDEYVPIARVNLKLEAGVTGFTVQQIDGNGPPIFFRRDYIQGKGWNPAKLYALKVHGDSMEPSLYDGDLVVINTADAEPADGEVFAVNYEGQCVIKRLRRDAGQWWLDSDNPRYKPKLCDEHAILIGRVVYKQSERI